MPNLTIPRIPRSLESRIAALSSTRRTPDRPCTNCGDPTPGNFCPQCGQRKVEVRISLRRMLMEVLDDQFSLNSALPRTIGALFFRPGHLSREYVGGRIARYIPPFRLYLVSSLLFFVVIQLVPALQGRNANAQLSRSVIRIDEDSAAIDTLVGPAAAEAVAAARAARAERSAARPDSARPDSARRDWTEQLTIHTGVPEFDRMLRERVSHFRGQTPQEAAQTVFGEFMEHAPTMMFVLLPVFAAVMTLIFIRRKRFYVEHFVFALHVHAFCFLSFALAFVIAHEAFNAVVMLWMMIYIYLAMKRFYAQGWIRTGVKYMLLGSIYTMILTTAFMVTFAISLFLI